MKREVSNSMSKENDPQFYVITPICKVCKNSIGIGKCKKYGEAPKEYTYAKSYECSYRDIDENSYWYFNVKEKLKWLRCLMYIEGYLCFFLARIIIV